MDNKRLLKRLVTILTAFFAVLCLTSTAAFAGDNDFRLSRLCVGATGCGGGDANSPAIKNFKQLSKNYAAVMAPGHFQPASTLGEEGFEIAAESKISFAMDKHASYGAVNKNQKELADGLHIDYDKKYAAPDVMATTGLHMRKGLPFSFEIEGAFSWLANSELFYVDAGLRWAFTEGWWFMPDISVRADVGVLLGSADMSMINVNADVALSYTWGLGGICSITPYAGYKFLTTFASSRPLLVQNGTETNESVFGRVTLYQHRAFAGVELQGDYFIFGLEGEFGADIMSAGAKVGARF